MLLIGKIVAIGACIGLFYTWLGFPLVLELLARYRRLRIEKGPITPFVSVIVAARNEGRNIAARINDLLQQDYPVDALEIIIASDGSSDRTAEIARGFGDARIRVLDFPESRGRAAVHNDAVTIARGDILVFTDAATRFEPSCLRELASNFNDPRVGCVSADILYENRDDSSVTRQRGLYWTYELWLRKRESQCGIFACASGPCMAVRRSFYRTLIDRSYDVDFITPLDVVAAGALVLQDPAAVARDQMFATPSQEIRAQIRMVSRNLGGYLDRKALLNSGNLGASWALISHKILRWLTPFFMAALFVSSTMLLLRGQFEPLCLLQCVFYVAAALGWLRVRGGNAASIFSAPYAFCLASAGFLLGVVRCIRRQRVVVY
jgi:cellulose synthase/poly-beta-1,6-N-acetylglucosamine synthase-like glycosyltransferase